MSFFLKMLGFSSLELKEEEQKEKKVVYKRKIIIPNHLINGQKIKEEEQK